MFRCFGATDTSLARAHQQRVNRLRHYAVTPTPLDAEHGFTWSASDAPLEAPCGGEASELLIAAAEGSAEVSIEHEQRLGRMVRLVQVLRGESGPYR